jgi:hypothetical protein
MLLWADCEMGMEIGELGCWYFDWQLQDVVAKLDGN